MERVSCHERAKLYGTFTVPGGVCPVHGIDLEPKVGLHVMCHGCVCAMA